MFHQPREAVKERGAEVVCLSLKQLMHNRCDLAGLCAAHLHFYMFCLLLESASCAVF